MQHRTIVSMLALTAGASAQTSLYTIYGDQPSDGLGHRIVALRDVDGDGFDDILASLSGVGFAGSVRVYSGANGTPLYTVPSAPLGSEFGTAIESLEDVDGDGVPDFAVGDDLETAGGLLFSGAVHVYSGVDGTLLYDVPGYDTSSHFGEAIARVGDIDLDGAADFLVQAKGEDTFFPASALGVVRLFSGRTGSLIHVFTGSAVSTYGIAIAGVGDVDLDGRPDFAISSTVGQAQRAVRIHSGATFAVLLDVEDGNGIDLWGSAIAGPGDVDGDGRGDLVVGAPGTYFGYIGEVFVYSGATGALLYRRTGDSDDDGLGIEVSGVGDLDQDGFPELAAMTRKGPYTRIYSGASGTPIYTIRESNQFDALPSAIAGLGDLDGDGRRELAVSGVVFGGAGTQRRIRVIDDASAPPVGAAFCAGDGSAGACPCGNATAGGAGCANSIGLGARLEGFGASSVAADTLFLTGAHMPVNTLTILFQGDETTGAGSAPAGDGLRCIGGTLSRMRISGTNQSGDIWYGTGLRNEGHWDAGDTRHFQVYYRNPPGPCASGFNVSNALSVTFTP